VKNRIAAAEPDPAAAAFAPAERTLADDVMGAAMRHWKIVALIAAAVMLLAWLAAGLQPTRYRASSMAAVTPITDDLSPSDIMRGVDTLDRRVVVASVAALASAPVILSQAGGEHYDINSVVLPNTNLFRVEVEGTDPRATAAIANKIPLLLNAQSRTIYKMYGVLLVSPAPASATAVLPRIGRAVAAGLIFGLLVGVAVAWLLDRRRFA
jgi:uncharacterized protein involved in exopolysaccharide biosynthesis